MTVAQTSGRKVGVQGLGFDPDYPYISGNTPLCNLSGWQLDGTTLDNIRVAALPECLVDFFGSRSLWSTTSQGHAHPPAPYHRFELIVRVPTDIATLADGEYWEGWASCDSTDLWFADYANPPSVCDASNWSSTGGGFVRHSGWFQVRRTGNSWRIVGYRAEQRVNEWPDVLVQRTRGSKTTTACQSGTMYYEVTTPIRYWLTIGY